MTKEIMSITFKKMLDEYLTPADVEDEGRTRERLESFGEDWQFMSVEAEATICIDDHIQTIWGGNVGALESDVSDDYLLEYKSMAFDDLAQQLHAIGFGAQYIESFRQKYMETQEEPLE